MQTKSSTAFTYSNEIYFQGYFDGACFLYSVANAFKALTRKDVEQEKWNKAVGFVPFQQDFTHSEGGTVNYDCDLVEYTIRKMLKALSPRRMFSVVRLPNAIRLDNLADIIDCNTVVLFAIGSNTLQLDHWLCAVSFSAEPKSLHLACSSPHAVDYNKDYSVRADGRFKGRYFNWQLADFSKFHIQEGCCYSISLGTEE